MQFPGLHGGCRNLRFDIRVRGGFQIIQLASDLGILEYVGLTELFEKLSANGPPRILLDMSTVTSINSTCGAVIIEHWKQYTEAGGYFGLLSPSYVTLQFLTVAGIEHLVECFDSVEDALEAGSAAE